MELLRRDDGYDDQIFWDWGIATADAVREARPLCDEAGATLIASGGIAGPRDIALSIALGAHIAGSARPLLKTLVEQGQQALVDLLERWRYQIRAMMFLAGAGRVEELRKGRLRSVDCGLEIEDRRSRIEDRG